MLSFSTDCNSQELCYPLRRHTVRNFSQGLAGTFYSFLRKDPEGALGFSPIIISEPATTQIQEET